MYKHKVTVTGTNDEKEATRIAIEKMCSEPQVDSLGRTFQWIKLSENEVEKFYSKTERSVWQFVGGSLKRGVIEVCFTEKTC